MDEESLQSRISKISTTWTLLAKAHQPPGEGVAAAQLALVQRYQGAVYRYLLGATRDPDAADELFQEFALRLIQGAFRRADPTRGRFRDYLRTALYRLVADYHKQQRKRPPSLDETAPQPTAPAPSPTENDEQFLQSWREELLARAWTALADAARQDRQPYYEVLKFRAENMRATSAEMAERLTEKLRPERPYTPTGIRKTLQRARERFANLLIEEVAHSLDQPTDAGLEQELIDLGLRRYCRPVLARRLGRE
jgi:RNA polymerase sigma-70 factor (ECF subfamily)